VRAAALVVVLLATLLTPSAATAQPGTQRIRWLALGDSYSSGEGVYGAGDGIGGSGDACARSRFAWARLAANWVEQASDPAMRDVFLRFKQFLGPEVPATGPELDVDMTFLACSGAETTDQQTPTEDLDEQLAQAQGTYDVITFSFGGNDSQFSPIIKGCLNPVGHYGCDEPEDQMTQRIRDEVAPKLDSAYRKIRQKLAPGGRVIVLGYPRLFDNPRFRKRCFGAIPYPDVEMLRRVADTLNDTIEDLARENYLDYVDVATPFEGRNACGTGIDFLPIDHQKWLAKEFLPLEFTPLCLTMKWVNGISIGFEAGGRIMHSFHPNLCGHVVESLLVAQRVLGWRAIGDAPAAPRRVHLYHGGLAFEVGEHETSQYQYGDSVGPIADHLNQMFPGTGDVTPVDQEQCGPGGGRMTWNSDGTPVLSICVSGDRFVAFVQHAPDPKITTPDGVTVESGVWRLMTSSGGQLTYADESRKIGDKVVVVHSYLRCDSVALGDPPRQGRLSDPTDWLGEIMEVSDEPAECGNDPVPAEQYNQGPFYFFTSPGGEYNCGIDQEWALCQGETQPLPPDPGCRATWGYGMSVDNTGRADFLCAGGLIYGPLNRNPDERDELPAGRTITAFGFTCSSEPPGMRCTQDASGHGFYVAPETNERF
jgi:hypothetical protein